MPSTRVSVKVEGHERVIAQLQSRYQKVKPRTRVAVGYSAPYSAAVHENLAAYHPHGQAKFLEQPARQHEKEMAEIVASGMRAGLSLEQAQLNAARFLLEKSKPLVPVLTGALRDSGFARIE